MSGWLIFFVSTLLVIDPIYQAYLYCLDAYFGLSSKQGHAKESIRNALDKKLQLPFKPIEMSDYGKGNENRRFIAIIKLVLNFVTVANALDRSINADFERAKCYWLNLTSHLGDA